MRKRNFLAILMVVILPAKLADGHGTPIHIEATGNALAVSGGMPDTAGFASMIFFEDDEDGDDTQIGSLIVWQLPGLEIFGMDGSSSLSLEVLARPVKDSNPAEDRLLWYWNSQTALVEPAPVDFHLLGTGKRSITLSPLDDIAPPPFLLANSVAGQQGFHNHGLLAYALDSDPAPPAGAYGFFARFTSNQYAPSDPFLVVFNHGITDYPQMVPAALAINAAATGLAGDYNYDGKVDAADYVVWRKALGSAPEYEVWRSNFGAMAGGEGGSLSAVPEPRGLTLAIAALCSYLLERGSYRGRQHRKRARQIWVGPWRGPSRDIWGVAPATLARDQLKLTYDPSGRCN